MFRSAGALSYVAVRSIDPTDHGSNLGVVAGLAVGILVFIGLLVFLITRRGRGAAARRPERLTISRPQAPQPRTQTQTPPRPRPEARPEAGAGAGAAGAGEPGGAEPDEGPG
jgi:hypothetical protein